MRRNFGKRKKKKRDFYFLFHFLFLKFLVFFYLASAKVGRELKKAYSRETRAGARDISSVHFRCFFVFNGPVEDKAHFLKVTYGFLQVGWAAVSAAGLYRYGPVLSPT